MYSLCILYVIVFYCSIFLLFYCSILSCSPYFPCPVTHLLTTCSHLLTAYRLLLSANIIYRLIRHSIAYRHRHPDQPIATQPPVIVVS